MGKLLNFKRKKETWDLLEGISERKRSSILPVVFVGIVLGGVIGVAIISYPQFLTLFQSGGEMLATALGGVDNPAQVVRAPLSPAVRTALIQHSVHFNSCYSGGGTNCVVDGDTFWAGGVKIRVSDIDAPETHPPRCPHEAYLGNRAASRLQELLNEGPVQLEAGLRDEDKYGRKLRVVTRNGVSLGMMLVSEGLAREWDGSRKPWC